MSGETLIIESHAPEETERLGSVLGQLLPRGAVVALRGELASGKTCLARGMAARFATGENVSSPTFTLVNEYGQDNKLYHVDLYRIRDAMELEELDYEDLFDPDGISVVEWADRAERLLPVKRLDVFFEHVDEHSRRLTFQDRGIMPQGWQNLILEAPPR